MFRLFEGQTADEVWCAIARALLAERLRAKEVQPSRQGDTAEILRAALSIADPKQRWVVSKTPPINPAFALAEIIWIVSGRNDAAFLTFFNRQLPKFAGEGPTFHGAYGYRLRHGLEFDQLERAYRALRHNDHSRQVVLQIWDGRIDMPDANGRPQAPDIPCNVMSILKVRNGKLEWLQILRSNDIFRGLPYNIVQFTSLQEIMAGWLGLSLGSYNQVSDSLHAYLNTLADLSKSDTIMPKPNIDSMVLPFDDSIATFDDLAARVDQMIEPGVTPAALQDLVAWSGPIAFGNILFVLGAEVARRKKWLGIRDGFIEQCSNPIYRQLWWRWTDRLQSTVSG